jgi:hypothetical protein
MLSEPSQPSDELRRPLGWSYCGQPAPGDGWSIRSATGGVFTGTK